MYATITCLMLLATYFWLRGITRRGSLAVGGILVSGHSCHVFPSADGACDSRPHDLVSDGMAGEQAALARLRRSAGGPCPPLSSHGLVALVVIDCAGEAVRLHLYATQPGAGRAAAQPCPWLYRHDATPVAGADILFGRRRPAVGRRPVGSARRRRFESRTFAPHGAACQLACLAGCIHLSHQSATARIYRAVRHLDRSGRHVSAGPGSAGLACQSVGA